MRFNYLLILCLIFSYNIDAQVDPTMKVGDLRLREPVVKQSIFFDTLSANFFDLAFLNHSLENVTDNLHPLIFNQIESTGNFANPNPYVFSFLGNSHKWNKYYWNGHRVDNALQVGSSLYKPIMQQIDLAFDVNEGEVYFDSHKNEQRVWLQYNNGNLGGRIPGIDPILSDVANHKISYQTIVKPVDYRRKTRAAASAYINFNNQGKKGLTSHSIYFTTGSKLQTTFDYTGLSGFYNEGYSQLLANGSINILKNKFDHVGYIIGFEQRDNLYSEYYYGEEETANYEQVAASIYGDKKRNQYSEFSTGINIASNSIQHNNPLFSRNVVDQDLEGIEPWYASGTNLQLSHSLVSKQNIKQSKKLFWIANMYNSLLHFNPTDHIQEHHLYFQPTDSQYQSLQVLNMQSQAFSSALLQNSTGLQWEQRLKKWDFETKAEFALNGFAVKDESFYKIAADFSAKIERKTGRVVDYFGVLTGYKHTPFTYDIIQFYSNDYLNGNIYSWDDTNNDKQAQDNELTDNGIFGGKTRKVGAEMNSPAYFYLQVPITFNVTKNFQFSLILDYRKFNNLWWLDYADGLEANGNFITEEDKQIFVETVHYENQYVSSNFPEEKMQINTETDNWLFNDPFTGSATFFLSYLGPNKRFRASFSYNAYMIVGWGALGNGVLHNNIAVLSNSLANPNSTIFSGGRLDADRSFVARLFVSYNKPKWSIAFQGKYKDGQSFSATRSTINQGEFVMWPARVKGDNPFNGDFGSREVYYFQSDLRFRYRANIANKQFTFNIQCYNIADFGLEIIQYNFEPITKTGRRALDFQIPRGVLASIALKL